MSGPYTTSTAAPRTRPSRRRASALFASSSANVSTSVRTGTRGASARNSSPSRRVRFATERSDTLSPEQLVRERRDVRHVDAGADDDAALRDRAQRRRDELAGGGEDDRRVELLGRRAERVAGPLGAELERELPCRLVPRSREREHPAPLVPGDLDHDVSRRAEAVEAEPLGRRRPVAASGSRSARRRGAAPPGRRRSPPGSGSSSGRPPTASSA